MIDKEIFGCTAFGLEDQVFQVEGEIRTKSFYLSDAVLPEHPLGAVLTGDIAKEERVHSGLYWPLEARIPKNEPLRRAPIPCIWRGLVEARDKLQHWNIGRGVNFSFSRILSNHVVDLLKRSGCEPHDDVILAIPDALDEFGQEALIRDFNSLGYANIHFLWRPVAAALSWLSELDQNNSFDLDTNVKEHIIVVCLGADCIEMITFKLERVQIDDVTYVVPVRERPKNIPKVTGFDWAANCIESACESLDDGGFWQAFTEFPHVWEAMAGRQFSSENEEWCVNEQWTLWKPAASLIDDIGQVPVSPNRRLRRLLEKSCQIFSPDSQQEDISADESLRALFSDILSAKADSQLRGIIIAGSLCPSELPHWIKNESKKIKDRGIQNFSKKPHIDTIWLAHRQNAIMDGCAEYGRRVDLELPTYLDTLPKLSMLVEKKGEHVWVDLLKSETCQGGKDYILPLIQGRFGIRSGTQNLQVYLKKGEEETTLNPYRRAEFTFPSTPHKDMPVDVSVKIRPASGLAQILLIPSNLEDSSFLRGHEIFLDYSTMIETEPPKPPSLGWPNLLEIQIDPYATFLNEHDWAIKKYMQASPEDYYFMEAVEKINKWIIVGSNYDHSERRYFKNIDHKGLAGTKLANQAIGQIVEKASRDFPHVQRSNRRKFLTKMSWLFIRTPENLKEGIRLFITNYNYTNDWNWMVEAAGRSFNTAEEFKFLFSKIIRRIKSQHRTPFPINCTNALYRILSLRDNSPNSLEEFQAKIFTEQAIKIMEKEKERSNFKQKFFKGARLFLFLLRFRFVKPNFLDPENPSDEILFDRALACLDSAQNYFSRNNNPTADRAKNLVKGIEEFMHFEGNNEILIDLDEFAGD